jgi:hypothetical protein
MKPECWPSSSAHVCQALELAAQGFGPNDPHVASAANNLAEFYRLRRRYDEAEPLYKQASARHVGQGHDRSRSRSLLLVSPLQAA